MRSRSTLPQRERQLDPRIAIPAAGFEQQHVGVRVLGQPRRERAAGRAGADDDGVDGLHVRPKHAQIARCRPNGLHDYSAAMRLSRLTTRRELIASDQSSKREATMSPKSATARLPNRDTALKSLYDDISAKKMFPFWATSADVEHDEIKQLMGTQRALPHLWSYKSDIEPILHRAADLVTMDDSRAPLADPGQSGPGAEARHRLDHVHGLPAERSERDHAAAQAFAERHPLRPHRQGQFHRRRRREHHVRPGRHGADAERHLAQSRQQSGTSRRSTSRCSTCRWSRR